MVAKSLFFQSCSHSFLKATCWSLIKTLPVSSKVLNVMVCVIEPLIQLYQERKARRHFPANHQWSDVLTASWHFRDRDWCYPALEAYIGSISVSYAPQIFL